MTKIGKIMLMALLMVGMTEAGEASSQTAALEQLSVAANYFVANRANAKGKKPIDDRKVHAYVQTRRGRILFTDEGAFIGMTLPSRAEKTLGGQTVVLKAGIPASVKREPRLDGESGAKVNLLVGQSDAWQREQAAYQKLVYEEVWPGIDLEYLGYLDKVEFRLQVAPWHQADVIEMETGAARLSLEKDGSMTAHLAGAWLHLSAPLAWQIIDGQRHSVSVAFKPLEHGRYGFELGKHDVRYPLTIDPVVSWGTYLGGSGAYYEEIAKDVAVDAAGDIYVVGHSPGGSFPVTPGSFDTTYAGSEEAFVTKLSADGSRMHWSSYLGGSGADRAESVAVDASGNVYVTGSTTSTDFPTSAGVLDESHNGGTDVFVAKISADGSTLTATLLGGAGDDYGYGVAVDAADVPHVVGSAGSSTFPATAGTIDPHQSGADDAFVVKLSTDLSSLIYGTFLGTYSAAYDVAIDSTGSAVVVGDGGANFPVTSGAYDETYNGNTDIFVARLATDGASLHYSTFIGGNSEDHGHALALYNDVAYITGYTTSSGYPTTAGAFDETYQAFADVVVSAISNDGSSLALSTFVSGRQGDRGRGIAVDSGGIHVVGYCNSRDFPTTAGALDETIWENDTEGFAFKLDSTASNLLYCTGLGGDEGEFAEAVALDASGNAIIVGQAQSPDFPVSADALEPIMNLGEGYEHDAFVIKLNTTGSTLLMGTFLSGSGQDMGNDVVVDDAGNIYLVGNTKSQTFPTTAGAFDEEHRGGSDGFVVKLDSDGTTPSYITLLGGNGRDEAHGVAIDDSGNAYVVGTTTSSNFPTTAGAFDETHNGGSDAFALKLDSTGASLIYSTYLGGTGQDRAPGMALGADGSVYLGGSTNSTDFPVTVGAFDETHNTQFDAFVARLSSDGSTLMWATYLGGVGADFGTDLDIDSSGNAYLTGYTASINFPTTVGAFDTLHSGENDAFVAKIDSIGASLGYSTYLGAASDDIAYAIAVDGAGSAHVAGKTTSTAFPTTTGAYDTTFSSTSSNSPDGFITKVNATGTGLTWSTYLGGRSRDAVNGLFVDNLGQTWLTGYATSSDFPISQGLGVGTYGTYLARLDSDGNGLTFSAWIAKGVSLLDGEYQGGNSVFVDEGPFAYVTGTTANLYTATDGVYQSTSQGGGDVFLAKIAFCSPDIGGQLGDATQCAGADASFSLTPGGTGPFTYQWHKDGVDLVGETDASLTLSAVSDADEGRYSCSVTNSCGTEVTDEVVLTVIDPVQITTQPQSDDLCVGETLALSVTATGQLPLVYQWYKDNVAISGANAATYTIASAASTAAGSYTCKIVNSCSEEDSTAAVITVSELPQITQQPDGADTCVADTYTFTVTATGDNLTYQWQKDGVAINEATTASYHLASAVAEDSGSYTCVVTSPCSSITSGVAEFTVSEAPAITAHPVSATVCSGLAHTLSTASAGTFDTFQWQKNGVDIAGATGSSHTIDPVDSSDMGTYRCVVTNACGQTTSNEATLNIRQPVSFAAEPEDVTTCLGANATFTVSATGMAPLLYQWQKNGLDIAGANEASYSITDVTAADFASYSCLVTNICGSVSSAPANLIEGSDPVNIIDQPQSLTSCPGVTVELTLTAIGSGPISYQWYKDEVLMAGEIAATLTLTDVDDTDEGSYDCEVTNPCGTETSAAAELAIDDTLGADATPAQQAQGLSTPTFDVVASCPGVVFTAEWVANPPTTLITNGTAVTLDPPPVVTTTLEVTITDEMDREATATAIYLVPINSGYEDYNGDGCNTIEDLWLLAQEWMATEQGDPNDDGQINLLDLMYIQVDDGPCP